MKFALRFLFIATFLLISVHRLPAPILEESPTPVPKPKIKARSEHQSQESKATESKPSIKPFVGVWSGIVNGGFTSDVGLNVSKSVALTIKVLNDGTIQATQVSQASSKADLSADGRELTWPYQYSDATGSARGQGSLRLIGPNTASYQANVMMTLSGGSGNAMMRQSGTLTKQ